MAVKNLLDGSMELKSSDEIRNIDLDFTMGLNELTVQTVYVKSGNMCTLFIPRFTFPIGPSNQLINMVPPPEIAPIRPEAFYGFQVVDTSTPRYAVWLANPYMFTLNGLSSSLDTQPFGAGPVVINYGMYITYQINN